MVCIKLKYIFKKYRKNKKELINFTYCILKSFISKKKKKDNNIRLFIINLVNKCLVLTMHTCYQDFKA